MPHRKKSANASGKKAEEARAERRETCIYKYIYIEHLLYIHVFLEREAAVAALVLALQRKAGMARERGGFGYLLCSRPSAFPTPLFAAALGSLPDPRAAHTEARES